MAASTNDKFKKVAASTVTTLSAPGKALGATSINVGSTTNFPTTTGIIIAIRTVDTSGNLVAGTYTEYSATVNDGTSFAIVGTPVYGSDQIYAAGSTTQVFIPVSPYAQNALIDGILVHANQDGTLKANSVGTTQIADGAITSEKMAGSSPTWNIAPALTWVSSDGPTHVLKATGVDVREGFNEGVRVKLDQVQAIQNYWTFDSANTDSKGGATMTDIGGGPSYLVDGKFSKAATFNGSSQGLTITDSAAFNTLGSAGKEFTISCWVKTSYTALTQSVFQSWSAATNWAGIIMQLSATSGFPIFIFGTNTSISGTTITGNINVCDGSLHQIAVTYRNNFAQMYVDAKLVASGWAPTPIYTATNYVRIGAYKGGAAAETLWFNGQIDDLFIATYAFDEQTIAAKYNASPQTAQGLDDITINKKALCSAPATMSGSDTLITVYTGTDYAIGNSAITNPFYSPLKAPYGFPLNPAKWTVTSNLTTSGTTNTPTASTWYNITGNNIIVPIGKWRLFYNYEVYTVKGSAGFGSAATTLSRSASALTDNEFYDNMVTDGTIIFGGKGEKNIEHSAKTTWYANHAVQYASTTSIASRGVGTARATSALL